MYTFNSEGDWDEIFSNLPLRNNTGGTALLAGYTSDIVYFIDEYDSATTLNGYKNLGYTTTTGEDLETISFSRAVSYKGLKLTNDQRSNLTVTNELRYSWLKLKKVWANQAVTAETIEHNPVDADVFVDYGSDPKVALLTGITESVNPEVQLPLYTSDGNLAVYNVVETDATREYLFVPTYDPSTTVLKTDETTRTLITITNTLPVINLTLTKTWDDLNDKYGIRPSTLVGATPKLHLWRSSDNGASWTDITSLVAPTATETAKAGTWTYVYSNLPQFARNKTPYLYKVTEDAINAYRTTPVPASVQTTAQSNTPSSVTSATQVSAQSLGITNTLIRRDVTVKKSWEDNGNIQGSALHYDIDVRLSAKPVYDVNQEATEGFANLDLDNDGQTDYIDENHNNRYDEGETFKKYVLNTSGYDPANIVLDKNSSNVQYKIDKDDTNGVTIYDVPVYDRNNALIVYEVDEKPTTQSGESAFSYGDKHYGYVFSYTANETNKGNDTIYHNQYYTEYDITNTLPVTNFRVDKNWTTYIENPDHPEGGFVPDTTTYSDDHWHEGMPIHFYVTLHRASKQSGSYVEDTAFAARTAESRKDILHTDDVKETIDGKDWYKSAVFANLLVYDYNNSTYAYEVIEDKVIGYADTYSPAHSVVNDAAYSAWIAKSGGNGDILTPAVEGTPANDPQKLRIYNEQITSEVKIINIDGNFERNYGDEVRRPLTGGTFRLWSVNNESDTPASSGAVVVGDLYRNNDGGYYYIPNMASLTAEDLAKFTLGFADLDGSSRPVEYSGNLIPKQTGDEQGMIQIIGLPDGRYLLEQTSVQNGYLKRGKNASDPEYDNITENAYFRFNMHASHESYEASVEFSQLNVTENKDQKYYNTGIPDEYFRNYENTTKTVTVTKVDEDTMQTVASKPDTAKVATYVLIKLIPYSVYVHQQGQTAESQALWEQHYTNALLERWDEVDLMASPSSDTRLETLTKYWEILTPVYRTAQNGEINVSDLTSGTYFFLEVQSPYGYEVNNAISYMESGKAEATSKLFEVQDTEGYHLEIKYPNPKKTIDQKIIKVDEYDNPLNDAEFELYYKGRTTPPTYSMNSKVISPTITDEYKIINSLNAPNVAEVPGTEQKTVTYEYQSIDPTPPSEEETNWIMPRTDNDYIYFRDWNSVTPEWDDAEQNHGKYQRNWLYTSLGNNDYGHSEEIMYNHDYWIEAQFTKADGSGFKKYGVWERFVDNYNGSNTIVWKIQPPDGYKYVRFCLYCNSTCIRTTALINYEMGTIYHKNGYGDYEKKDNYWNCYWNVPVTKESNKWSSYWNSSVTDPSGTSRTIAPATDGMEHRKTGSNTALNQAEKYEPTEQKIIFQCNSNKVWHNIHIEFFDKDQNPIGQRFPGYLMEPYAYADQKTYRIDNYLTYELTIPKGAYYFRVNNGSNDSFKYYTAITKLHGVDPADASYTNDRRYRNYRNYFKLNNSGSITNGAVVTWDDNYIKAHNGNKSRYLDYDPEFELDSDYDYIYFEKPSGWGNNIYAYYYAGGDLRGDNWQRAVYSAYPGVAPVGLLKADGSNVYSYTIRPESTFTKNGKTIYKFKRPLGDRTNYDKVVFNDGYKSLGGGHESKVINYQLGQCYNKDGNTTKMYEYDSTTTFTKRGDYLYILKDTADNWDDIHVTFYNAGGQIHQQGDGYIMKYAGASGGKEYFSAPIPDGATRFSLNNGYNKGDGLTTALKDIPRLSTTAAETAQVNSDYTLGDVVYTLSDGKQLSQSGPTFQRHETVTGTTGNYIPVENLDYTPRGDYLYIRNDGNWDNAVFKATTIQFYDVEGNTIGAAAAGLALDDEPAGTEWIRKTIPTGAASFSINSASTRYAVYTKTGTTTGSTADFTNGDMLYTTAAANTLNTPPAYPTFTKTISAPDYSDETYSKRGDTLYLVTDSSDSWNNMHITFYDSDGNEIVSGISGKYTGELSFVSETDLEAGTIPVDGTSTTVEAAAGKWYKASVPNGAVSFRVYNGNDNDTADKKSDSTYPIFTLRNKPAWARQDYTYGDMQYRISSTGTNRSLERFYPVFTENPVHTMPDNDDINSGVPEDQIFTTDTGEYRVSSIVSVPDPVEDEPTPLPVLYSTNTNEVTYEWEETSYYDFLRFAKPSAWSSYTTVYAYFFNPDGDYTWPGVPMTLTDETRNGRPIYSIRVPKKNGNDTYKKVIFVVDSSGANNKTEDITLTNYGHGYLYYVNGSVGGLTNTAKTVGIDDFIDNTPPAISDIIIDNKIRLTNSQNWSSISAKFYNGNTLLDTQTMSLESGSGTSGIWITDDNVPANTDGVIFTNGTDSTEKATVNSDVSTKNYIYSITYTPACTYSNEIIVWGDGLSNGQIGIYLYDDSSPVNNNGSFGQTYMDRNGSSSHYPSSGTTEPRFHYTITQPENGHFTHAIIWCTNNDDLWRMEIELNSSNNYGEGQVYKRGSAYSPTEYVSTNSLNCKMYNAYHDTANSYDPSSSSSTGTYTASSREYTSNNNVPTTYNYSSTYQPEDRYGMISNANSSSTPVTDGNADENNYIYITGVTDPYVKFFDGSGAAIGGSQMAADGIKLTATKTIGGTSYYYIRLPKNAQSFSVNGGAAKELYEDITVEGQTINDFHHAGSRFTVDSTTNAVTGYTTRTGYQTNKPEITYPLEYKSDKDYIFFTDTNNWAGSDTIYAYYYGGADGEYSAWPGVPAQRTYKDNTDKTVYVFQPPTNSSGDKVYPYVIFNNGSSDSRKITQAVNYTTGNIYTPNNTSVQYGNNSVPSAVNAYGNTGTQKASYAANDTQSYNTSGEYIYIINNGTKNLFNNDPTATNDRYILDDLHIRFFSDADGTDSIGSVAGYYPDEIAADYDGYTVYRIKVPSGAQYFNITNGFSKGDDFTAPNYYRYSEVKKITPDGMYRFVQSAANNADYIEADVVPTTIQQVGEQHYLLEIANQQEIDSPDEPVEASTEDVHLATIVTGDDGLPKYIKWLKPMPAPTAENPEAVLENSVDTNYLDHVFADVGEDAAVKSVKTVKYGTYYWKEIKAPDGYTRDVEILPEYTVGIDDSELEAYITRATDTGIKGTIQLTKTAEERTGTYKIGDAIKGAEFELYKKPSSSGGSDTRMTLIKKTNESTYRIIPDDKELPDFDKTGYDLDESTSTGLKEYTSAVTNETGQLTVSGIAWGDYYLKETATAPGFVVSDKTTGKTNNEVGFTVGRNNCELLQRLSCTNETEKSRIKLTEIIDDDMVQAWGDPTFIFRLRQTSRYIDEDGTLILRGIPDDEDQPERIIKLTVPYSASGSAHSASTSDYINVLRYVDSEGYIEVEPGAYEISRVNVSRYDFNGNEYEVKDDNDVVSSFQTLSTANETITVTIPNGEKADVTYHDVTQYYDKYSHVDNTLNIVQGVKGFKVDDYVVPKDDTSNDAVIFLTDLTFKHLQSNGVETAFASDELTAMYPHIAIEYIKGAKDDSRLKITDENDEDYPGDLTYTYDTTTGKGIIRVENVQRYYDYVIRLKATYDGFTTYFNLIMPKKDNTVKTYERKIIFRTDIDNYTYFVDTDSRADGYSGKAVHTSEYELTFTVIDNNGTRTVPYVRHNGQKITEAQINALLQSNLLTNRQDTDSVEITDLIPADTGETVWLNVIKVNAGDRSFNRKWSSGSDTFNDLDYTALVNVVTANDVDTTKYTADPIKIYTAVVTFP